MHARAKKIVRGVLLAAGVFVLFYLLLILFVRPSNDRNWNNDQQILAYIGEEA